MADSHEDRNIRPRSKLLREDRRLGSTGSDSVFFDDVTHPAVANSNDIHIGVIQPRTDTRRSHRKKRGVVEPQNMTPRAEVPGHPHDNHHGSRSVPRPKSGGTIARSHDHVGNSNSRHTPRRSQSDNRRLGGNHGGHFNPPRAQSLQHGARIHRQHLSRNSQTTDQYPTGRRSFDIDKTRGYLLKPEHLHAKPYPESDFAKRLSALSNQSSLKSPSMYLTDKRTASGNFEFASNPPKDQTKSSANVDQVVHPCCGSVHCGLCIRSPRLWSALASFTAALMFLGAMNTDYLPKMETLALRSILPNKHIILTGQVIPTILIIIMWGEHFVRRFAEILFVHDYERQFHIFEAIAFNIYYPIFGFWIGWACNYFTEYQTPKNYILIPGLLIFVLGEVCNCVCHVMLMRTRTSQQRRGVTHVIPTGCLFRYTTVPHYWFELVTWVGFAIVTFTLPSFIFLALNFVIIIIYMIFVKNNETF